MQKSESCTDGRLCTLYQFRGRSEFADLIESYEDNIEASDQPEAKKRYENLLSALLFDARKMLIHALRLVDAEEEIKAP